VKDQGHSETKHGPYVLSLWPSSFTFWWRSVHFGSIFSPVSGMHGRTFVRVVRTANAGSVSVRHTRELRLNSSRYQNTLRTVR